ncbi:glycine cleavage system protein GcvH [Vagococcus carniphilus]|uniref:Glycine cleavage system H protein n=1 Tax=Vagococcus carniphilus TaxID=218144 RepID=A0AAW8U0U0_9ENTE|nr:glycine cleavage system protein GcvH [Vagococcus carniphilus]MDT2815504.1 glycine cleavage system protein GcvH [Vagococcus carniphilus]MDT2829546.1 glycine cleavage system protein GcvH [Vagococcus carniphilus]MDT2833113.1 glycine cleavage system protein GcvH [Vagococcus carniphilus]MDT2839005.1 glycine cleavage system protein GcvH [Vagococcus carniphilus]MDT2853063.1 glycine cleavage system protein GcvH [Vagococcus carniphilus]
MSRPKEISYLASHEWVKFVDDETALVGITDFAQEQLGDIVFVELPEVGTEVSKGDQVAEVESVKTVSDIYTPFTGVISKINEDLDDAPESVNEAPFENWLFEVKGITEKEELIDLEAYNKVVEEEA